MRLAMVRDGRIIRHEGGLYTNDAFIRFISNIAALVDGIDFLVVLVDAKDASDVAEFRGQEPITLPPNVRLVPTYDYRSVVDYYRKLPGLVGYNWPLFRRELAHADAVFLSIPSINCIPAYEVSKRLGKPVVSHVSGYQEKVVSGGGRYRGVTRFAAVNLGRFHGKLFERIIHGSRAVFYLGSELAGAYPPGGTPAYQTFTSLITGRDICPRASFMPDGKLRLLYVGRISHEKGLYGLLDALPAIADRTGREVSLRLCGTGPEMDGLRRKVADMGIEGAVDFAGFVSHGPEMAGVFDESDIMLLPSVSEGVPKVLVEGMARGLPVVASDVGGIPDVVTHGTNGLLIRPGTPDSIVEAVAGLASDPALMRKLSDGGISFAHEHTADIQAARMVEVIREAANA